MGAAREQLPKLTPEEYFAWEEQQEVKHEYFDGEVFAVRGGTREHSRIAVNLTALAYDRGDKFELYRKSPSLREYVLVNTDKIAIDLHCKDDLNQRYAIYHREGDTVELETIASSRSSTNGLRFPIERIYRGFEF